MIKWILLISCFLSTLLPSTHVNAQQDETLKAAFVRGGELWVKQANKELQLTNQKPVYNPKWSSDGEYIAYSSGKDSDTISVYSFKSNKSYPIYKGGSQYEWSPNRNILAFQITNILNITYVQPEQTTAFENVSLGVGNYSWLPNGNGFLVSSTASLLPNGWSDINLYTVPLDAHMDPAKVKPYYTLPHESQDFFAVSTSSFKWSKDGKWIAFIAEPTASLASDSNTLCLLSSDTKTFKTLDKMLHYEDWFQWAPTRSSLAFIQGQDRLADRNKHLHVADLPSLKVTSLADKGYVAQEFTWNNDQTITVSRAKENQGPYNSPQKALPVLYKAQLQNSEQKQITHPPKNSGDFSPYFLTNTQKLTWFRSDLKQANVWMANSDGSKAKEFIHNVDMGMSYYGKVFGNSMIAWYEPREKKTIAALSAEPAYAKWGQLAMSQVKNKYQADIVDYKHLGRKEITPQIVEEDFKFWLRSGNREFGVFVKIRFDSSTEKVQSISIQEG